MDNQSTDDEPSSRLERRELLRQDDVLARVVGDMGVSASASEPRLLGDVAARVVLVRNGLQSRRRVVAGAHASQRRVRRLRFGSLFRAVRLQGRQLFLSVVDLALEVLQHLLHVRRRTLGGVFDAGAPPAKA